MVRQVGVEEEHKVAARKAQAVHIGCPETQLAWARPQQLYAFIIVC